MEQTHNTMMVMAFDAPMNARQHSSLVWPLPVSPADDPHNSAGCDCIHRYQHTNIQHQEPRVDADDGQEHVAAHWQAD